VAAVLRSVIVTAPVDDPVPPFATGNIPVTPVVKLMGGMSAATSARNVGVPVEPFGAAKTVFAVSDARVAVRTPDDVTGEPVTVKILGNANPTEIPEEVPVPPLTTGNIPVTPVVKLISGRSPDTSVRKVGIPAARLGAAKTVFAVSDTRVAVNAPVALAGDPLTEKMLGIVKPMDTPEEVPVPPFTTGRTPVTPVAKLISGMSAGTRARKVGTPDKPFGAAKTLFAVSDTRVAVNVPVAPAGDPLTEKILGIAKFIAMPEDVPVPPFTMGKIPVTPVIKLMSGMSAGTRVRKVGVPAEPLGAAKIVFAVSDTRVAVRVPDEVIGDPLTEKILGIAKPTDVTVPRPGVTP